MAARHSWADLPPVLVAEIARFLPCVADRVRAARACRTWLEGVLMDPCPPQLPWLLLPYQTAAVLPLGATRRATFFCVLCDGTHRVAVPDHTGGARFFGAYLGGWLFLAYGQNFGHGLINLHTHESLHLPDRFTWDGLEWLLHPMRIRAATLSAPPASPEGCVAAAIVTVLIAPCFFGPLHVTFWRMGSSLASCTFLLDAEDVIYHNGAFHFLTPEGDLVLCTPEFQDGAPLEQLQVRQEVRIMMGDAPYAAGDRYLVECRGELLMVLRIQPRQGVASSFRVFRMTQEQVTDAVDGTGNDYTLHLWTELPALEGRMLFVGRGCSRSFEAAHFPGAREGVYFLDDGSFHAAPLMGYGCGDGPRQYGCCNNGVWSGPRDHVRYWFPGQLPSTYSSPVWLLH